MPGNDAPLILALVDDLFFVSRIENVVQRLGFQIQFVENAVSEAACGQFAEMVAEKSPALILIDLNLKTFPWADCIPVIKASPQISQIPILAFGSHKDVPTMTRAKEVGIDVVLAKSRFTEAMGTLIRKHARKDDW
jgi:CheY-like chemotaxis protein